MATTLGKKVGETVTVLDDQQFQVVGVFEAGTTYEDGMMIMSLEKLQKFMGRERTGYRLLRHARGSLPRGGRSRGKTNFRPAKNLDVKTTQELVDSTSEIQFIRVMAWVT